MKEFSAGVDIPGIFGGNLTIVNDETITGELPTCISRFFYRPNKLIIVHVDKNNIYNIQGTKT